MGKSIALVLRQAASDSHGLMLVVRFLTASRVKQFVSREGGALSERQKCGIGLLPLNAQGLRMRNTRVIRKYNFLDVPSFGLDYTPHDV
jgi:hypothetical protein